MNASQYSRIREKNLGKQALQTKKVFEAIPDLRKLHIQYATLQAQKGMLFFQGKQTDKLFDQKLEKIDDELSKMLKDIEEMLVENGFEQNFLKLKHDCELCKDYGFIDSKPCVCNTRAVFEKRTSQSNLTSIEKENFETFDINVFPQENNQRSKMQEMRLICEEFCESFPNTKRLNLLLRGPTGLGKSFLLNCIGARLLQRNFNVRKLTANEFVKIVMESIGKKGDYSELYALQKADLLILDDLGSEPIIKNVTENHFFSLINERIMANKNTICATNQTPAQLLERYGERTASRLLFVKLSFLYNLEGKDIRLIKRVST